jgi:hypothetical protein
MNAKIEMILFTSIALIATNSLLALTFAFRIALE